MHNYGPYQPFSFVHNGRRVEVTSDDDIEKGSRGIEYFSHIEQKRGNTQQYMDTNRQSDDDDYSD